MQEDQRNKNSNNSHLQKCGIEEAKFDPQMSYNKMARKELC